LVSSPTQKGTAVIFSLLYFASNTYSLHFLQVADHTVGSPIVIMSSVHLSVTKCIVAKWYILQQKCLKKWMGNTPRCTILQLSTSTPSLSPQTPPLSWSH